VKEVRISQKEKRSIGKPRRRWLIDVESDLKKKRVLEAGE
jgi:hypothetical protein